MNDHPFRLHAIAGLPRTGSTLLCNLLNQYPAFHASSTSPLPQMLRATSNLLASRPEFKGDLNRDPEATEDRLVATLHGIIDGWHGLWRAGHVFDKSRGWTGSIPFLQKVDPQAKTIVLVRDLRDIVVSIERQYRKTEIFGESGAPFEARLTDMFSPEGLIGQPLIGLQDILNRNLEAFLCNPRAEEGTDWDRELSVAARSEVLFIRFEDFVQAPQATMDLIHACVGVEAHSYDTENVINVAKDPDGLYLQRYPHTGAGKIKPPKDMREKYMSPPKQNQIVAQNEWFYKIFYRPQPKEHDMKDFRSQLNPTGAK